MSLRSLSLTHEQPWNHSLYPLHYSDCKYSVYTRNAFLFFLTLFLLFSSAARRRAASLHANCITEIFVQIVNVMRVLATKQIKQMTKWLMIVITVTQCITLWFRMAFIQHFLTKKEIERANEDFKSSSVRLIEKFR